MARRVVGRAFALPAGLDRTPGVFDRGAAAFDQRFRLGEGGAGRHHHGLRHRRGGERSALALGLAEPHFQPGAAVGELAPPPVECRAAGRGGGDGFGRALQFRFGLGEARRRLPQPRGGRLPRGAGSGSGGG